jgi:hypothetical protein
MVHTHHTPMRFVVAVVQRYIPQLTSLARIKSCAVTLCLSLKRELCSEQ